MLTSKYVSRGRCIAPIWVLQKIVVCQPEVGFVRYLVCYSSFHSYALIKRISRVGIELQFQHVVFDVIASWSHIDTIGTVNGFESVILCLNCLNQPGEALATITVDAATILGIDDRVGSLEVGKDGDVALYDGDPFEYTTHCVGVVIEGEVVSRERR